MSDEKDDGLPDWGHITDEEFDEVTRKATQDIIEPEMVQTIDEIWEDLQRRKGWLCMLPPDMPHDWRKPFSDLLREKVVFPSPRDCTWRSYGLTTQHLFQVNFLYPEEWIDTHLWLAFFSFFLPSKKFLERAVKKAAEEFNDSADVEELKHLIVACIREDIDNCLPIAKGKFLGSLKSRLGTIALETCRDLVPTVFSELKSQLNDIEQNEASKLRELALKNWQTIEKARLQTPEAKRPVKWTDEKLRDAICNAVEAIPITRRSYQSVAAKITEQLKLGKPLTEDALFNLVKRKKLRSFWEEAMQNRHKSAG